jgi:homoserine O-acetyltransferase/O-succinyltransferase
MDWQSPAESLPSAFVTEALQATLRGTPPVTGAWRDGDHLGNRQFCQVGSFTTEHGDDFPHVRIAYEILGN